MNDQANSNPNPASGTEVVDEHHIIAERREKLAKLREGGVAFPNDFVPTHLAANLHTHYDSLSKEELAAKKVHVKVAGRMVLKRVMGKASFATIQDRSGQIQFYINDEISSILESVGTTTDNLCPNNHIIKQINIDLRAKTSVFEVAAATSLECRGNRCVSIKFKDDLHTSLLINNYVTLECKKDFIKIFTGQQPENKVVWKGTFITCKCTFIPCKYSLFCHSD